MNQQNSSTKISIFLIILAALIFAAVLLSSAMRAGGWMFIGLIVGIVVIIALLIKLVSFVVRQYVIWTEAHVKAQETRNAFLLNMAKVGLISDGEGGFKPIQIQQISAPAQAQPRGKIYDFTPNGDMQVASVAYILFSIDQLGDSGNRLASAPECASASNILHYSARNWEKIVTHLSEAYDVVRIPGPIQNGGGVYVPESIGTIGRLYKCVALNAEVMALPENKR